MNAYNVTEFYNSLFSLGTTPTEKNYWVYLNACHIYKKQNVRWIFLYWANEVGIYFHHTTLIRYNDLWHWVESSLRGYGGVHTGRVTPEGFYTFRSPEDAADFVRFCAEPVFTKNRLRFLYQNLDVSLPCSDSELGLSTKLIIDLCSPRDLYCKLTQKLYSYLSYEEQKHISPNSPGTITPDRLVGQRFIIDNFQVGGTREEGGSDYYAVACCGIAAYNYSLISGNREVHLVDLAVHPNFRHAGLGCKVVGKALEYCKAMSYEKLYWYASKQNHSSISLALRLGFEIAPLRCNGKLTVLKLKL